MIFRDYQEKDFINLKEMMLSLQREDPAEMPMNETKIKRTVNESLIHPEKIRIIILCMDVAIAGYSILVFYWSNEHGGNIINIDELYVRKEYRGKQIASNFIKHLITKYRGAVSLQLETTPSNEGATRLYKRLGFIDSPNHHMVLRL